MGEVETVAEGLQEGLRQRKKRATRGRILDVARELFMQHGFDATTVEAIAAAAAISKPTLFNYFPSKQAVLLGLVPDLDHRFATAIAASRRRGGTTGEQLRRFFAYAAEVTQESPLLIRAFLVEALKAYGDSATGPDRHRFVLMHHAFVELIQEGVARGEVRDDIRPGRLAHYITGVYMYELLGWLANPNYGVEVELREAATFLEGALLISNKNK